MSMRNSLRALRPSVPGTPHPSLRLPSPSLTSQHAGPSTIRHQRSRLSVSSSAQASVETLQSTASPSLAGINAQPVIEGDLESQEHRGRLFKPILLPISSLAEDPSVAASSGILVELPSDIFAEDIRRDILHRNVVWYLASIRRGTVKTLGRSEVAYSGKKIRPQKGTGKARLSDRGSPMLVGGAHAHNLRPKSWYYDLPRKIRAYGYRAALSLKLNTGFLRVVSDFSEADWSKTKQAATAIAPLEFSRPQPTVFKRADRPDHWHSILFLHAPNVPAERLFPFARALRNIPGVEIMSTEEVHVWHMLKYRWLVVDGSGLDAMVARLRTFAKSTYSTEPTWQSPLKARALSADEALVTSSRINPAMKIRPPRELQWRTRAWRRIKGKKSMVRAIGFDRAAAREYRAKRDIRRAGRLVAKQRGEERWQRVLDKLERKALERREQAQLAVAGESSTDAAQ